MTGRTVRTVVVAAAWMLAPGLAGCDGGPAGPDGREHPDLAYLSYSRDSPTMEVLVAAADGGGERSLFRTTEAILWLRWSPDGKRLAFVEVGRDSSAVHVVDVANGAVRNVTGGRIAQPLTVSWLRDGRLVIRSGISDIWRVDADGANPIQIIRLPFGGAPLPRIIGNIHVSPDGSRLLWTFGRYSEGFLATETDIYVADADGSGVTNLTRTVPGWNGEAVWGPDGKTILFRSDRNGQMDLFRMSADGTGAVQLTRSIEPEEHPSVSPDGRWITFDLYTSQHGGLYVMRADGSGLRKALDATDLDPVSWSPRTQRIATAGYVDGAWQVLVGRPDGGAFTVIRRNAINPVWRPGSRE